MSGSKPISMQKLLPLLLVLILAITSLSVSVARAQETPKPVATTEASEQDQDIQTKVRGLLREIPAFKDVFVTTKGGVVTLKGRVLELDDIDRAAELAQKIEGVLSINNQINVETSVEKRIVPALERIQNRFGQFMSALPIAAMGLVILAIVITLGYFITSMKYPWDKIMPNRFLGNLLRQMVFFAFIIAGIVLALDIMGATALLGTILGAAGIVGLALGFAVRDTVENYIASILLSFRQPFRPRDAVLIDGHEGYVIALTSRATILLTYDGNHVRIPNSTVFKGTIINYSLNPERRFDFELGVETEDLQRAVDLGLEVIRSLSFVLKEPAADGWINKIGDSSMVLWFGGWINQNNTSLAKARSEAIRQVKLAFEKEGIGLPEPIYRLRFDSAPDDQPAPVSSRKPTGKPRAKSDATDKKAARQKTDSQLHEADVSPDLEIEKKITEETSRAGGSDLLDDAAARELE